jgi:trigger factor
MHIEFKEELLTMSVQVENLEKNMAKLTIEVAAEEFEKAVQAAYMKNKNKITIPGFRKGKAPRVMIEKMYGTGIFFEDAANALIQREYPKAADESGLDIVSYPEIDVVQVEKGKSFIFTAEVAVKPEVTLGEYKGLEVEVAPVEVTEEEVAAELKREQENNSRTIDVDDRAVAEGDMVTLDFEGFVDGEAFEGGKGTDYPLTIGSNSFIPGFEDQLVGAELNTEVEVNVTFPENYHANDLAGKPAVFKCTVKAIKVKELPELDDEFAKDVSEFDTLDEYKADIEKNLRERKEGVAKREREDKAVDAVIANAQMDIPEAMIQNQIQQLMNDFVQRMQAQGLSIDQYYQFTGLDQAKIQEQMRPQALKRIQSRLVLEKVAEVENIQISDEKFEEELKTMADMYKMEVEKLKELMGDAEKEQMKKDIAVQEAVTLVAESAKVVEKKEEAAE